MFGFMIFSVFSFRLKKYTSTRRENAIASGGYLKRLRFNNWLKTSIPAN
jgi:hypothetical protein